MGFLRREIFRWLSWGDRRCLSLIPAVSALGEGGCLAVLMNRISLSGAYSWFDLLRLAVLSESEAEDRLPI